MNDIEAIRLAPDETLLRVTGTGEVVLVPDVMTLSIAVVTLKREVREATDENATTMTEVIAALMQAGIAKADIKTHQLRVSPQRRHSFEARFDGFEVTNGVTVRIRDIARAGTVITAAFDAGANAVHGPTFGTADTDDGLAEARTAALADARSRAEACAAGLGLRVGRILSVSEGALSGGRERLFVHRRAAGAAPDMPIEEGDLRRSMTVAIAYALVAGG